MEFLLYFVIAAVAVMCPYYTIKAFIEIYQGKRK